MSMIIAAVVAFIAAATTALTVSIVLDDWIWLVLYMLIVPTALAMAVTYKAGPWPYTAVALATVFLSGLSFSWVQGTSGYMEIAGWHLFAATLPVTLVVGMTSAILVGIARWRTLLVV